MNRLITSIILLLAMTAGCFYSVYATSQNTERLSQLVDMVEQSHTGGNTEQAKQFALQLQEEWDKILHYSVLVNDLGHAMEITSCIAEITSFAEEGNDEIYAACDRAQAQLELFREMQTPTLWKIL